MRGDGEERKGRVESLEWGEEMEERERREKSREKSWADQMEDQEEGEGESRKGAGGRKTQGLNVQDVVVASCSDDGTVRLWRPLETNTVACLTGHAGRVLAVAGDREGRMVSVGLDRSLRLWSPQTVSSLDVAGQHNMEVTCMAAGWHGNTVLSADRSGAVIIWQKNDGVFQNVYRFRAHEKSVNAACFVNKDSTRFVTGSDDMTLAVWEIMQKKNSLIVRKKLEEGLSSPVTSLLWDPLLMPRHSEAFVLGTGWDDHIFYKNLNSRKEIRTARVDREKSSAGSAQVYDEWPLGLYFGKGELLLTATDGTVSKWQCQQLQNTIQLSSAQQTTVPTSQSGSQGSQRNWVLAASSGDSGFCFGDSLGQLSFFRPPRTWNQMKVHGGAISSVVEDGGHIFTASHDTTIKVWTSSFTQLGQFHCKAPVTSLCRVGTSTSDCTLLMAGDQLGNVYHLSWRR